jgi:hypothetical protein
MIDKLKSYSPIINDPEYDKSITESAKYLENCDCIFGYWNEETGVYQFSLCPEIKIGELNLRPCTSRFSSYVLRTENGSEWCLKDSGYWIWSFKTEDEAQKFCDHIGRELVK